MSSIKKTNKKLTEENQSLQNILQKVYDLVAPAIEIKANVQQKDTAEISMRKRNTSTVQSSSNKSQRNRRKSDFDSKLEDDVLHQMAQAARQLSSKIKPEKVDQIRPMTNSKRKASGATQRITPADIRKSNLAKSASKQQIPNRHPSQRPTLFRKAAPTDFKGFNMKEYKALRQSVHDMFK